jgi:3-hydroxyisobutyrate dehydrogenase-like beta-hydroxyacid dehydrogenase
LQTKIGFIGFGEAAFYIAKGLSGQGMAVGAYDRYSMVAQQSELIQKRAREARVNIYPGMKELIEASDIIISAVSASLVVCLAQASASYLKAGQFYVDINAAGTDTKVIADKIISPHALFVDAAVMGPVPTSGHKVPILVSGGGAAGFIEKMRPYGMNIAMLDGPAGKASASKMFRSIFMKGFVTLLIETVVAGRAYNIEDDILASINTTLTESPLPNVINSLLARGVIHSERREHEMDEVIAALRNLNLDSTMSEATKTKLRWCTNLRFKEYFQGVPPKDFHEIFKVTDKLLK